MIDRIRHNYPSLIQCLWAFHILCFAYLLFRCYCYNHYKIPKTLLLLSLLLLPLPLLSYHLATKHFAADTKFPGVVKLPTQLLILENILWLPLCRIYKFGLNTLPSKAVVIPYTCGLSVHRYLFALEHRFSNTSQVLRGSHWSYDPVMVPSLWVSTARADTQRSLGF